MKIGGFIAKGITRTIYRMQCAKVTSNLPKLGAVNTELLPLARSQHQPRLFTQYPFRQVQRASNTTWDGLTGFGSKGVNLETDSGFAFFLCASP